MASAISIFPLTFKSPPPLPSNPSLSLFLNTSFSSSSSSSTNTCWVLAHISNTYNVHSSSTISFKHSHTLSSLGKKSLSHYPSTPYSSFSSARLICRAAEYKFPDPIPEFADAETEKFRNHLIKKLSKKDDLFGDSLDEVVGICTEIFNTFLHTEYGGPGTLLVVPFIDMADTLNEQGLPGGPQAARAAVKWAQAHVDKDWKEWTSADSNQ
ncbi:hypothetical protein CsSME_00037028 [Camellia sinensis var. sinensis]